MKKCAVICNLESGKGIKDNDIKKVISILEKNNYQAKLYATKKAKDATELLENLEFHDLVLSIGGDGTLNEVLTGNYKRKERLLLAHIPIGTTNDIGNMLGMKKNIVKNLETILDGEIKQIDVGIINNQPFLYVCGYGKFINVPYETSRKLKKKLGHLAYLLSGAKEFFQKTKAYEIEYEIDNQRYVGLTSLVIISNANRIAGFNNIYKNVKLNDSKFEIVLCSFTKRKDIVKSIMLLMTNDITNIPGFSCYRGSNIKIKFKEKPSSNWTIDGEYLKDKSYNYNISIDKNFKMLLPKKNLDKLFED